MPHIQGRNIRSMTSDNAAQWNYVSGSRPNIMITTEIVEKSVEAAPLGILSIALSRGYDNSTTPLFFAYTAFLLDLIAILSNSTSIVYGRLKYISDILASLLPKSIPFKTGTLTYSWKDVNAIQTVNAVDVRGYKYYLYVPGTGVNPAGWKIMDPPPIPTDVTDSLNALSYMYNIIGNSNVPHLSYIEGINLGETYKFDISSFTAGSNYYGASNSVASGAAYSIEAEAPFQSTILSGYSQYSNSDGRVGKKFALATGDTTSGLSMALLPGFFPELYNTCYPTNYSYLDLDEVVYFLQFWYSALCSSALSSNPPNSSFPNQLLLALQPFQWSPQQFRIMVAACIRTMFATSQSVGQFLTFSQDPRGFEPLRMGTNCYGANRETIYCPLNLVENLRMLQPHIIDIKTKFYNRKNQWILSPIWGIMNQAAPPSITFQGLGPEVEPYQGPMFVLSSANDPSVIDGTLGGICCDLNSPLVTDLITEWNLRIGILKAYAGNTAYMEGSSNGCLLFQTRYAEYNSPQINMKDVSPFLRHKLPQEYIQKIPRTPITRTNSLKSVATVQPEYDEVYVPINGSLFTQQTTAFSSVPVFTTAQKVLINYLIYPVIVQEANQPPTTQQVRVTDLQCNILPFPDVQIGGVHARALDLEQFAQICVPGLAASNTDELSSLLKTLSDDGEGGFLKDVCVALAGLIPW